MATEVSKNTSGGKLMESRNKLNAADLADLKTIAQQIPEGDRETREIGVIYGKVRGLTYRNNPQDPTQPSIGLLGVFRGEPAAPDRLPIASSVAFLPKGVHDHIVETVRGNAEDPTAKLKAMPAKGKAINVKVDREIQIAVLIGIRKSNSPIGYEFVGAMKTDAQVKDPLEDMSDLAGSLKGQMSRIAIPAARANEVLGPGATQFIEDKRQAAAEHKTPVKRGKKR